MTEYVKTEMRKVDDLTGARKGSVGFALTTLQRRLASSPEAIYQSLVHRRQKLERRLEACWPASRPWTPTARPMALKTGRRGPVRRR